MQAYCIMQSKVIEVGEIIVAWFVLNLAFP